MAIYKCGRGDETWSAVKQLQIAVRTGLELGTSGFQDRRSNHSATLPHVYKLRVAISSSRYYIFQNVKAEE